MLHLTIYLIAYLKLSDYDLVYIFLFEDLCSFTPNCVHNCFV